MITISEIARLAGTTPRAVRLYHQRGLLPEPERAANGYRSYGPDDLLALLRIRRLRELGLAIARIAALVMGPADGLRAALEALDAELAAHEQRIAEQRRVLAEVQAMPGDIELPPPLAGLFAEAVAAGYPERALAEERDAVLIALALEPRALDGFVAFYRGVLADPEQRVRAATVAYEALAGVSGDDPRVEEVAAAIVEATSAVILALPDDASVDGESSFGALAEELFDRFYASRSSPAQLRASTLARGALEARFARAPG